MSLAFFSKGSWYNPQGKSRREYESRLQAEKDKGVDEAVAVAAASQNKTPPPSLDAAWAFFEHITLARYFDDSEQDGTPVIRRAEAGETEHSTRLYPIWGTTEAAMGQFGAGVGVYFFKLRAITIITIIAAILSSPTIFYYSSTNYNDDGQETLSYWLRGSAICTDKSWEPCPTCSIHQLDDVAAAFDRYANATTADGTEVAFILKNNCTVDLTAGICAWFTMIFVIISIFVFGHFSMAREVELDEAVQTTTDYSIGIDNPPADAYDPEEWRDFFSNFGAHVTCCTVAIDNERLTYKLVARRKLLSELEMLLPPGMKFNQHNLQEAVENAIPIPWYMSFMKSDAAALKKKIDTLTDQLIELGKEHNDVVEVFVTFETEQAQRQVLEAFSIPKIDVMLQRKNSLLPEHLFRGKHVLDVREPAEPSAVRWQDLDEGLLTKALQRTVSFSITFMCIIGSVFAIYYCRERYGAVITAFVVTGLNSSFPMITPYINNLESHRNEGSSQASLYIKNTLFMWMNTSLITNLITPFADTLNRGSTAMIPAMYAIFVTEMLKSPVTAIVDPYGHFQRHYLAPRALDQRRMNLNFLGTSWLLSERETDLTNVIFLTFYYSSIFPSGFIFATITLIVRYWVDKFCLLRVWARAPLLGTGISAFSRRYFLTLAVMICAIISAYNFSAFPFDNACATTSDLPSEYIGTFNATDGEGNNHIIIVESDAITYAHCDQDFLEFDDLQFPPFASKQPEGLEWMNKDQVFITGLFGWTSVIVTILVLSYIILRSMYHTCRVWFGKPYEPSGKAMDIKFSDLKEKFAYVPQIRVPQLTFPLIACDVSDIDDGLIGWSDPLHSHTYHNIIFDIPALSKGTIKKVGERLKRRSILDPNAPPTPIFSVISHWPPEKKEN